MTIDLVADKTHTVRHDLNFAQERYEAKHSIVSIIIPLWGGSFSTMKIQPTDIWNPT